MNSRGYNHHQNYNYSSYRSISTSTSDGLLQENDQPTLQVYSSPSSFPTTYAKHPSSRHASPPTTGGLLSPLSHHDPEHKGKYSSHLSPSLSVSSASSSSYLPHGRNELAHYQTSPTPVVASPKHSEPRSPSYPYQYQYLHQSLYISPARHTPRRKTLIFYVLILTALLTLAHLCINVTHLVRLLKSLDSIKEMGLFTAIPMGYILVLCFLTAILLILLTSFFKSAYPPPLQRSANRGYSHLTKSQKLAFVNLIIFFVLWVVSVAALVVEDKLGSKERNNDTDMGGGGSAMTKIEVRLATGSCVAFGMGLLLIGWGHAGGICCSRERHAKKAGRSSSGTHAGYGYHRARHREEWEMGD